MRATAQEVTRIVIGMEPDQVTLQHAAQQLTPHGQDSIDLTARERSMQEESNADIVLAQGCKFLAENLRKKHEVVVVDPDQVPFPGLMGDSLREQTVRLTIRIPGSFVENNFTRMVMQERPQD